MTGSNLTNKDESGSSKRSTNLWLCYGHAFARGTNRRAIIEMACRIMTAGSKDRILHLTLHRRYFAQIAAKTKRLSIETDRHIGKAAWTAESTTKSCFATATREMLQRCWSSFAACVAMPKVVMPFGSVAFSRSSAGPRSLIAV
jgi:hypothetical protein